MKKSIYIMITLAICNFSYGQYAGQTATNMSAGDGGLGGGEIATLLGPISENRNKNKDIYADFQGSPYTSNEFTMTTMFYGDENLGKVYYRYNALNEEVEVKNSLRESEGIKSLTRDKKISILVDGKKMSFMTFVTSKDKTLNGYLSILSDNGDYKLFKRTHIKFTEGKPAANSFVKAVPARFAQFIEYYFQKDGVNRIDEIPLKNSKLLKLLDASERDGLKKFLKDNSLNIKEEADLIQAFNFLNK
ncbi:MAG: hypothetical protein HKP42_03375 [Maribacter sp.]|nr:hypothetical protein [Maribacter sp.]NNK75082.1 hypothetical protein [Maribacter sp.]